MRPSWSSFVQYRTQTSAHFRSQSSSSFLHLLLRHLSRATGDRPRRRRERSAKAKFLRDPRSSSSRVRQSPKKMLPTASKGRASSSSSRANPMLFQYLRRIIKVPPLSDSLHLIILLHCYSLYSRYCSRIR